MVPIQLLAGFNKSQRRVRINGTRIYFWASEFSKTSHRPLSRFWFCMDNFGFIEMPSLAQNRHVMQSQLFIFIENLVVRCYHFAEYFGIFSSAQSSGFILHGALVTFVRLHTSQFGPFGKGVNKLCFPPALFYRGLPEDEREEESLAVHLSNLTISLSILPWMVDAILVSLFPTFSSCSPTARVCLRSPGARVW